MSEKSIKKEPATRSNTTHEEEFKLHYGPPVCEYCGSSKGSTRWPRGKKQCSCRDCTNTQCRDRVAELEDALEPFVEAVQSFDDRNSLSDDYAVALVPMKLGDIRRGRKALSGSTGEMERLREMLRVWQAVAEAGIQSRGAVRGWARIRRWDVEDLIGLTRKVLGRHARAAVEGE